MLGRGHRGSLCWVDHFGKLVWPPSESKRKRRKERPRLTQLLHQSPPLIPIQPQFPPLHQVFSRHCADGDKGDFGRLEAGLSEEGLQLGADRFEAGLGPADLFCVITSRA